jgi:hypothetical protein
MARDAFAVKMEFGAPQILSYTAESGFSSGLSPSTGTTSTSFTYKVVYTGNAPALVWVCTDGSPIFITSIPTRRSSSSRRNDANGGAVLSAALAAGAHVHYFEASTTRALRGSRQAAPAYPNVTPWSRSRSFRRVAEGAGQWYSAQLSVSERPVHLGVNRFPAWLISPDGKYQRIPLGSRGTHAGTDQPTKTIQRARQFPSLSTSISTCCGAGMTIDPAR